MVWFELKEMDDFSASYTCMCVVLVVIFYSILQSICVGTYLFAVSHSTRGRRPGNYFCVFSLTPVRMATRQVIHGFRDLSATHLTCIHCWYYCMLDTSLECSL